MELGQHLETDLDLDQPILIFFVSTFCSKCIRNREILQRYIKSENILEIDIAQSNPVLEELQPQQAPTVVVLDSGQRLLFHREGVLSEKMVQAIAELMNQSI